MASCFKNESLLMLNSNIISCFTPNRLYFFKHHTRNFAKRNKREVLLNIKNVSIDVKAKNLLFDANLKIHTDDKFLLMGINGSGKSSILKAIKGEIEIESGNINTHNERSLAYLPQDVEVYMQQYESLSVTEYLFEYHDIDLDEGLHRLDKLLMLNVTQYFGITKTFCEKTIISLSGGEKSKLLLCAIILSNPDCILLDEPSNHLDEKAKNYLAKFIRESEKAFILVSHDERFNSKLKLKNLCIDHVEKKLIPLKGSFQKFIKEKEAVQEQQENINRNFNKEVNALKHKMKALDKKRSSTSRYVINDVEKTKKLRRDLQSKKLQQQQFDSSFSIYKPTFAFAEAETKYSWMNLENIKQQFDDNTIIDNFSCEISSNSKIGLTGSNGSGKTTLLKILANQIEPSQGNVTLSEYSILGYLPQHTEALDTTLSVFQYMESTFDLSSETIYRSLRMFFENPEKIVDLTCDQLSTGQKRKLQLILLAIQEPDILLLDEPTNHLDKASIEVLSQEIKKFNGTILISSHDNPFIKATVGIIWDLNEGAVTNSAATRFTKKF